MIRTQSDSSLDFGVTSVLQGSSGTAAPAGMTDAQMKNSQIVDDKRVFYSIFKLNICVPEVLIDEGQLSSLLWPSITERRRTSSSK